MDHIGTGLYQAALIGGAAALCSPRSLTEGGLGDFVVINPDTPILWGVPRESWLDALIFGARRSFVKDVFVAGEQVIFDGRHPKEEEIYRQYQEMVLDQI